ncbi:MAG TPA: ribosomal-protein-alanine N-acetyltransferase [Methylophaga sp.]|nr:ribosomal-protein-alanine N-acetyltransferase [Methylophaga sp.]
MNVRIMQAQDIVTVLGIEQSANQFPWDIKSFQDSLKTGYQAWVFYKKTEEIVGFAIVQRVLDEAHLLNICVKPAAQGRGLGKAIIQHVIDYANSISAVIILLEVRRSNERAQQLYLQSGFNEMSVRKGYYPAKEGREDAILMAMDLDLMSFFSQ